MPSITNSSSGKNKLKLYAHERNALTKSCEACGWLADCANSNIALVASDVQHAILRLLELIPADEKTTKQTA
jgi:hypothetical protein